MKKTMQDLDVLSQVAETFRLRGSVGGVFALQPPWGLAMPKSDHASLIAATRGRIYLEPQGGKRQVLELTPGDVVAMPHGDAYALRDHPRTPLSSIDELGCRAARERGPAGGQTEFIALCCELAGGRTNPLLKVLPPLIHFSGSDVSVARWLEPTMRLVAAETCSSSAGRTTILNRLVEVVFIQLIRVWVESLPEGKGGWLRALRDPQLASALGAIHSDPGASWTVASLAARAGMSRSAFAERFRSLVGEPPLEYLTRWRMQRAASLLEADGAPLKEIVARSGYASEAAFRTAFTRWAGVPPGRYRTRAQSAGGAALAAAR